MPPSPAPPPNSEQLSAQLKVPAIGDQAADYARVGMAISLRTVRPLSKKKSPGREVDSRQVQIELAGRKAATPTWFMAVDKTAYASQFLCSSSAIVSTTAGGWAGRSS